MQSGKGSSTSTSTQTPAAMGEYQMLLQRLNQVGSTPYTPYGGQLVADMNPYETKGMSDMASAYGSAQPYIDEASKYARLGASPIQQSAIENYSNPYQDMVTKATMNQLQNTEQANNTQAMGATLGSGGLFNDRAGVMQGQLANQESLANAQTLGGLNTANYNQALGAAQADRSAAAQAAYTFGNLGQENLSTLLQGAQGEMGAGQFQQQQQQHVLDSLYGQWQQAQAFPYQQLSWMAGLGTGIGSQMGGTSSTTHYPQQPNPWNQGIGLGMFGLGAYNAYQNSKRGGRIKGLAGGGVPELDYSQGFIPDAPITMGKGAPDAPKDAPQGGKSGSGSSGFGDLSKLGSALGGAGSSALSSFGEAFPEAGAAVADFLPFLMLHDGGAVPGFDTGGAPGEDGTFGSMPFGHAKSFIPRVNIVGGKGAPEPPKIADQQQQQGPSKKELGDFASGLGKAGHGAYDKLFPSNSGDPISLSAPNPGASTFGPDLPQEGGTGGGLGGLYRKGGFVHGYADGGGPDDDEMSGGFEPDPSDFDPTPMGGRGSIMELGHKPVDLGSADFPFEPQKGQYTDEPPVDPAVSQGKRFPPDRHDLDPEPEIAPAASGTRLAGLQGDDDEGVGSVQRGDFSRIAARSADRSGAPRGSQAWSNALMTAGAALMASRSPWLGSALGEAGLSGLSAYAGTQRTEEANRKEQVREALDAKKYETQLAKIDAAERRADKTLNLHTEQLAETRRYHDQQLSAGRVPPGFRMTPEGEMTFIRGGPHDPEVIRATEDAKAAAKNGPGMTPEAKEVMARSMIAGNYQGYNSLGRTAQGLKVRDELNNAATEIVMRERGMNAAQAAQYLNDQKQEFGARQIGVNTAARTAATRETNLSLILNANDAAIKTALEENDNVKRLGRLVPLNRLIQRGEVMTSDPALIRFGMANLQLAEHWARAMNPTGVMRESDRDMALKYLDTALSHDTYAAAVDQLHKQITRERDSMRTVKPETPIAPLNPNAPPVDPSTRVTGGSPPPAGGAAPPAQAAPPPQAPPRPPGIPPLSAWNRRTGEWRTPDGHIYDAHGVAVQ